MCPADAVLTSRILIHIARRELATSLASTNRASTIRRALSAELAGDQFISSESGTGAASDFDGISQRGSAPSIGKSRARSVDVAHGRFAPDLSLRALRRR